MTQTKVKMIAGKAGTRQVVIAGEGLPDVLLAAKQALDRGRRDQAKSLLTDRTLASVQTLIFGPPPRTDLMFLLGHMFLQVEERSKAEHWYRECLRFEANAATYEQLGLLSHLSGRYSAALRYRQQAVELDPDNGEFWVSLALDLLHVGRLSEGLHWLQRYVETFPDNPDVLSKLLFHSHYDPQIDPTTLAAMHEAWGRRHAPLCLARRVHGNDPTPERRLRIGYLGADFYRHSAAYTLEAILEAHDRERVTAIGYGNVAQPDEVTERFKDTFDLYRDIRHREDRALARLIEADRIDILVVLSGHTGGHRLAVCAYKPAPLIVDFGGINTTGLTQVDYRITDTVRDLPESIDRYVEKSLHIPTGFVCYRPPEFAPEVTDLPCRGKGHITFASFNNSMKVNPLCLSMWAQVLRETPDARLLLKFGGGFDEEMKARMLETFEGLGIARDRIDLYGWLAPEDHLRLYGRVDIALDTYPFNGGVTTLESLWMGVPVISLSGKTLVSRCGLGILSQAGLHSLAATGVDEFVARATALAGNASTLETIRHSLRPRMQASSLCDRENYARQLEGLYREIWREWCASSLSARLAKATASSSQTPQHSPRTTEAGVLNFFISEQSDLVYTVVEAGLPQQVSAIMRAIESADLDRASTLLDEEVVSALRDLSNERADAAFLLGMLLQHCRRFEEAQASLEQALESEAHPLIHFELGNLYSTNGRLSQAIACYQQAVDACPEAHELWTTLAGCMIKMGQTQDGLEILKRIVARFPDRTNHSKYLWHLHQEPCLDQQVLFEEHCRWAKIHAPIPAQKRWPRPECYTDRPLRVGYLSPDFCCHSVAYFFESLLDGHDRSRVEVFGYGNVAAPDRVTECLIEKFDHYRPIFGRGDQEVCRLVEADHIDILVDLAGHTGGNRLGVFAEKPAPIQVSFLGYPDTTGMPQMDYRFTDRWADSEHAAAYYTEELIRLETGFICYRPPRAIPDVGLLPALDNGYITFGSFNNNCKINDHCLELWSAILTALPEARMMLKFGGGDDESVIEAYETRFRCFGVDPQRVTIVGHKSFRDHFALDNQIDI
ncbi:MAG: tetratricopeptide repeat protein, partial [Planctomycetes bacterium]|nr:tetratricopeptide repeat protein [Planctomycetota bacterium]